MVCCRRVRAIDRYDVHACQHLVETFPVRGLELFLDVWGDPSAVVVVDLKTEGARALGDSLTDATHADNPETLAPDAVAKHPRRGPSAPVFVGGQNVGALGEAARYGQN